MENDQNNDLDILIEEETEDVSSPDTNPTTQETEVDYKALYEQEKAQASKLKRKLFTKPKSQTLPTNINQKESLPSDLIEKVNKLDLIEQKRQYGYEHGLSPEETDFIFQATGGKPTKEVLETPFIKHGLEGYRASKRVEANTPGSSSRGSVFAGKKFEELSADERANAFAERTKALRK